MSAALFVLLMLAAFVLGWVVGVIECATAFRHVICRRPRQRRASDKAVTP